MRLIVTLLALVLTFSSARADEEETTVLVPARFVPLALAPPQQRGLLEELRAKQDDGRRLRNGGIATTVVGSVLTGIGLGIMIGNLCIDCSDSNTGNFIAGAALITVGQVGVVTGIPLWAVGQYRASRAEAMQLALSPAGLSGKF